MLDEIFILHKPELQTRNFSKRIFKKGKKTKNMAYLNFCLFSMHTDLKDDSFLLRTHYYERNAPMTSLALKVRIATEKVLSFRTLAKRARASGQCASARSKAVRETESKSGLSNSSKRERKATNKKCCFFLRLMRSESVRKLRLESFRNVMVVSDLMFSFWKILSFPKNILPIKSMNQNFSYRVLMKNL